MENTGEESATAVAAAVGNTKNWRILGRYHATAVAAAAVGNTKNSWPK
jgi:hypothetical protein